MTKNAKPDAEKAKNYTAEQESAIKAAAPMNLEKAKAFAEEWGKSWRSVVAKAISLEVPYQAQEKPAKRPAKETKSEIVEQIENALAAPVGAFAGLEKATIRALVSLRETVATD